MNSAKNLHALITKNKNKILLVAGLFGALQSYYIGYCVAIDTLVLKILDGTLYTSFILGVTTKIILALAAAGIFYCIVLLILVFTPLWAFKYRRFRTAYRQVKNAFHVRAMLFLVFFCIITYGITNLITLLCSAFLGYIIAYPLSTWRMKEIDQSITEVAQRQSELDKFADILKFLQHKYQVGEPISDAELEELGVSRDDLNKIVDDLELRVEEKLKENEIIREMIKANGKRIRQKTKKTERATILLNTAIISAMGAIAFIFGLVYGDAAKNGTTVNILEPIEIEAVIVASTNNYLVVYNQSSEETLFLPHPNVTIISPKAENGVDKRE